MLSPTIRYTAYRYPLMLLAGAVMISFSSVYVKIARVSPSVSGFYRMCFGGIVLLALVILRQQFHRVDRQVILLMVFCSLWFAGDLFFWHRSILYVGPGLSTLLANFQVFLLAGIGIIWFGERISVRLVCAIGMAVMGLFFVVGVDDWYALGPSYRSGIVFGLLTAVCYAFYILSLRKIQSTPKGMPAMENLAVVSLLTAAWLALDVSVRGESFRIPDTGSMAALSAYGVFSQVIGWVLITTALPRVRPSVAGLLLLLQPTLAFVWDVILFQRQVTGVNMIGLLMAIAGIYLGSAAPRPANRS